VIDGLIYIAYLMLLRSTVQRFNSTLKMTLNDPSRHFVSTNYMQILRTMNDIINSVGFSKLSSPFTLMKMSSPTWAMCQKFAHL
jgi:hypothetical protein